MFFKRYDHRITTSLCGVDTTVPRTFIHSSPCPCFRGGLCFTPRSLSGPQGCVKVPDLRPTVASMLQLLHSPVPTVWSPDIAGPHFDSFILPLFSPFIVATNQEARATNLQWVFKRLEAAPNSSCDHWFALCKAIELQLNPQCISSCMHSVHAWWNCTS